jgi:hypothetical protein
MCCLSSYGMRREGGGHDGGMALRRQELLAFYVLHIERGEKATGRVSKSGRVRSGSGVVEHRETLDARACMRQSNPWRSKASATQRHIRSTTTTATTMTPTILPTKA